MTHKKKRKHQAILKGEGFWQISRGGGVSVDEFSIRLTFWEIPFLTLQKEDIIAIKNAEVTTIPFTLGIKVVGIKIICTKKQSPIFVYFLNFARYNLESLKFDLRDLGFVID